MIEKITVRLAPTQRNTLQYVDLDEVRIGLRARYSALADRWFLWLVAVDGSIIAGPMRMVPGLDLLLSHKHDPRVPPGQLFIDGDPPTAETMDKESQLLYRPVDQVI